MTLKIAEMLSISRETISELRKKGNNVFKDSASIPDQRYTISNEVGGYT